MNIQLPDFLEHPFPDIYKSGNYMVFDVETTTEHNGLPIYPDNSLLLACWELGPDHPSGPGRGHCVGNEYHQDELVRLAQEADFVVAHNAKFDIGWLDRCGADISEIVVYDTRLAQYVIGGNRWRHKELSLGRLATYWLGEAAGKQDSVSRWITTGRDTRRIPSMLLRQYCEQDVSVTHRVFRAQLQHFERQQPRLLPIVYTRCLLVPVLYSIERHGLYLDEEKVSEEVERVQAELRELIPRIEAMAGGLLVSSSTQLAQLLYGGRMVEEKYKERIGTYKNGNPKYKVMRRMVPDKSKTFGLEVPKDHLGRPMMNKPTKQWPEGLPATDVRALARLRPRSKESREFLALYARVNELESLLSKYLLKFKACCEEAGGRLLAEFNQMNTRTQRLSSSGLDYKLQFQNMKRDYKPMFRASKPGHLIGEADGAGLEFWAAGHLGRDAQIVADITNGEDIHSVTASVIWPDVTTASSGARHPKRQDAKEHTFKPLYGGRSGTQDEVRYYEYFREKYSGITAAQEEWINQALTEGKVETEWGLVYYFPDTTIERSGYITNSQQICNYPVQAFATAEVTPIALVYFWHYLCAMRKQGIPVTMELVNTVHDSVIAELEPSEVELFHDLAQECFIERVQFYMKEVYDVDLVLPPSVGVKVASRWGGKDAAEWVPEGVPHDDGEVVYRKEVTIDEQKRNV